MSPTPPDGEAAVPVADRPGYCVTSGGRVFSCRRGRWHELRRSRGRYGVLTVVLYHGGTRPLSGREVRRVDELVLAAFVGPKPDGFGVCHADRRQANCALPNLSYMPSAELRRFRSPRGSDARRAVLTELDVIAIRRRAHAGDRDWPGMAAAYGRGRPLTAQAVKAAAMGLTWRHVDAGVPLWAPGPRPDADAVRPTKLTAADVRSIRARLAMNEPRASVHRDYPHVGRSTIDAVARRKTWADV